MRQLLLFFFPLPPPPSGTVNTFAEASIFLCGLEYFLFSLAAEGITDLSVNILFLILSLTTYPIEVEDTNLEKPLK